MKKLMIKCSLAFAVSVVLFTGSAFAQTSDSLTPAVEAVCDTLLDGKNDKLWGLCNAFCEAQDCDSMHKFDPSCKNLLGNFKKRASVKMPCLEKNYCKSDKVIEATIPVTDCGKVVDPKICEESFQYLLDCEKIKGNDSMACVWDKELGCSIGKKLACCDDVNRDAEKAIELVEAEPSYWLELPTY